MDMVLSFEKMKKSRGIIMQKIAEVEKWRSTIFVVMMLVYWVRIRLVFIEVCCHREQIKPRV